MGIPGGQAGRARRARSIGGGRGHGNAVAAVPDAAAALQARGVLVNEFDAGAFQRRNQFRQGIDIAPNNTAAGLHAPDGGDGQAAQFGKVPLV